MRCSNCGEEINDGEMFCSNCGTRVDNSEQFGTDSHDEDKSRGVFIVLIVILVLILAGAGVIIGYLFISPKGETHPMLSPTPTISGAETAAPASTNTPFPTMTPVPTSTPQQAGGQYNIVTAPPYHSQPNPTNSVNSVYLYPSDTSYISDSYLNVKSQAEVRLILNEMYARHGYIFSDGYYNSYFSSQPWYHGTTTSESVAEGYFNAVEHSNKNIIVAYEKSKGWR